MSALLFSHTVQVVCMIIISVAVLTHIRFTYFVWSFTVNVAVVTIPAGRGGEGGRVVGRGLGGVGGGAESLSPLFYVSPYQ